MPRGRVHRGSGVRRQTQWAGIFAFTAVADNSKTLVAVGNAALLALRPFTIVRTHLELNFQSDQSAATQLQFGAFGIAVVNDTAAALGITAVPAPITNLDSDLWYVHQSMLASFISKTQVGIEATAGKQYTIDSKAMRKVNNDQNIVLVLESDTLGGGVAVDGLGRFLIKLH